MEKKCPSTTIPCPYDGFNTLCQHMDTPSCPFYTPDQPELKVKEPIVFDKWEEMRDTIKELHEVHKGNEDLKRVTGFLLNLMDVLDKKTE